MTQPDSPKRAPRLRVARGPKRPDYMGNKDLDRFMMMFTALMGEVSAVRERLDTHERLALRGIVATPEAIEAFAPTPDDEARRADVRAGLLNRVFRIVLEELEQAEHGAVDAETIVAAEQAG